MTVAAADTAGQQEVADACASFLHDPKRRVAVLQGRAGTGKTTVLRHLVQMAVEEGASPRLLAPTGRAARRAREVVEWPTGTIHSTVYLFDRTEDREDGAQTTLFARRPPTAEPALWIVDEASLVGNASYSEKEFEADQPLLFEEGRLLTDLVDFALAAPASKLLLVGDPHQLPPWASPAGRRWTITCWAG